MEGRRRGFKRQPENSKRAHFSSRFWLKVSCCVVSSCQPLHFMPRKEWKAVDPADVEDNPQTQTTTRCMATSGEAKFCDHFTPPRQPTGPRAPQGRSNVAAPQRRLSSNAHQRPEPESNVWKEALKKAQDQCHMSCRREIGFNIEVYPEISSEDPEERICNKHW